VSEKTRTRLTVVVSVLGVVGAILLLGAFSRSSDSNAASAEAGGAATGQKLPFVPWYWTMIVSPSDPNMLVLGTSKGLYRSTNAGKSWSAVGPKGIHMTSLAQAGDTLVAGGVRTASPNPIANKGTGRTAPDGPGVVAVSTDEGKTWKELKPGGLPATSVQSLATDPKDGKTLYALLTDGKLYRSTDEAASFKLVTAKLGIPPWAIAVNNDGRFVSGDMDAGSHISSNARAWTKTPFTDSNGGRMVMEYAVQPGDSKRILMSSDGIMVSDDGGKTWKLSMKSTTMFGPIAFAPSAPDTAYAVGFDDSLWRTDDAGKTWKKQP
jgi:photosystem II stability/assembly factor-like uncharacterized protein